MPMIERSRQRWTSSQQLFLLLRMWICMFGVCVCRVGTALTRVLIICCSRSRHSGSVGMRRLLRRVDVSVGRQWPVVRVAIGALCVTVATAAVSVVVALRSSQSVDEEHDDESKHQRRTQTAATATQVHTVSVRVAARCARFALLVRV